jgi:exodeoxyribonuclease V alpha subunit
MMNEPLLPLEEIEGTIERLTFHNKENGYTVAKFRQKGKHYNVTIVGSMLGVNVGESLRLSGVSMRHPEYGEQFDVKDYTVQLPATIEGIRTYLGSGLIKGIGAKMAESIVDHFGLETLEVIENQVKRLGEVAGIGPKRVKMIAEAWHEQRHIKEIMIFLQGHQISTNLAVKIYKHYGDAAISILRSDPYRLAKDVFGVAFQTADNIALKIGMAYDAPERIRAGLIFALNQLGKEGHIFATRQQLIAAASTLLDVHAEHCDSELVLILGQDETSEKPTLIATQEAQRIYLPAFYYAEIGIVRRLGELIKSPWDRLTFYRNANWPAVFEWLDKRTSIQLSTQQKKAVRLTLTEKVVVLTGGPGTGKSTVTGTIIKLLRAKDKSVLLTAPTGRAAKRLTETTGQAAQTIHRLLEWNPSSGRQFVRNGDNPLDADLIIVDEASMIDTLLMNHLLKAIKEGTHLLLVGDVDQLPSVGAGNVLRDLINSKKIPTVRLDKIYRQAADSYIIINAHRINQAQMPIFSRDTHDFFFFKEENPHRAAVLLIDIVGRRLPRSFNYDPERQIQVLSPMHRGPVGVAALNEALQHTLNPPSPQKVEIKHSHQLLREGDRVMQIRNNYEREVFNGDMGRILKIHIAEQLVQVKFDHQVIEYEFYELDQLTHSYAVSVHKSQGSEYPVIVLPLLTEHYMMLQRHLVYTAISRAKEMVVIVGDKRAIRRAVENTHITERNTSLIEQLEAFEITLEEEEENFEGIF